MPICNCSAYIQSGVQCSQCELEETHGGMYDGQCAQCGTTTLPDGESFCESCRAEFSERTPHGGGE